DLKRFARGDEDQGGIWRAQSLGKARRNPAFGRVLVVGCQEYRAGAGTDVERREVFADRIDGVGDLVFGAFCQFAEKVVAYGRRIKAGRTETIEVNVSFAQGQ